MTSNSDSARAPSLTGRDPNPALPGNRYLWLMFSMLVSVTIFESYDVTIFHLCTPDVARTFHLSDREVGAVASIVRLGGMIAFGLVLLSDSIGRKPLLSITVLLYTLFTLLTGLSTGLASFTVFQSGAQIFLSAEFAVATIMISEEFPDSFRGTGISLLNMFGLLGVVAAGALYGPVADSRWGWRGMYLIGVGPLILVAWVRRHLRETVRFEALRRSDRVPRLSLRAIGGRLRVAASAFAGPYRGRLVLVALLWNSSGLVSAPAVTFFALYAKRDHHWTSSQIGGAIVAAYTIGSLGNLICGALLDRIGRRPTTCLFYLAGALSMLVLFRASGHDAMLAALVAVVAAFQGARTATATYSTELFPTEIRATSYGLTVQVLGQIAALTTPVIVGALSGALGGLSNAVAVVSIGPVIGAILVAMFAPETRGIRLGDLVPAADAAGVQDAR